MTKSTLIRLIVNHGDNRIMQTPAPEAELRRWSKQELENTWSVMQAPGCVMCPRHGDSRDTSIAHPSVAQCHCEGTSTNG